jgi:hypothetical protein
MPLTAIQTDVLRLLAGNRQPESHLAGGTAINRSSASPRFSADLDFFHDAAENASQNAEKDAALLTQNGFGVDWSLREANMQRAYVRRGADALKLEWCHDSAFRFFPVQPDAEFGYCLHPADLATNKALALAGRAEIRDFIDILFLHESYLTLGAICWAACGKDQGFTPRSLLDFAKRHMKFREEDLARENLARPITLVELKEAWLKAADQAEHLFARLPLAEVGCLYLTPSFLPVTPDPASPDFAKLSRHFGSIRGAWPVLA